MQQCLRALVVLEDGRGLAAPLHPAQVACTSEVHVETCSQQTAHPNNILADVANINEQPGLELLVVVHAQELNADILLAVGLDLMVLDIPQPSFLGVLSAVSRREVLAASRALAA